MGFGYKVDFLDGDGAVIHTIPDSTTIKQVNLGGIDTGSMERFDSLTHFVRRGDNLATPSSFVIEAIISEASLSTLRTRVNAIRNALYSSARVKVYANGSYTFHMLPSTVALSHGILVQRIFRNAVRVTIYINPATSIAEYEPPALPNELVEGYILWLNAAEKTYSDAGLTLSVEAEGIREWHGEGSGGYYAVQGNSGNRPTFTNSQGFPAVRFSGGQWFTIPNYFWEGGSIFFVCKPEESSNVAYRSLMGYKAASGSFSIRYLRSSNDVGRMRFSGGGLNATDFKIYGDFYVQCVTAQQDELKLYVDDVVVASDFTGSVGSVNQSLPLLLGALYYNSTAVDKFLGYMTDVVMYDRVLDANEIQQNINFFRSKDNAIRIPTLPANVTGAGIWLAGDEHVYKDLNTPAASNNDVQLWKDKSGHRNAYQTSSSAKPTFEIVDGIKALYFDGAKFLRHTYFGDLGTCFVVAKLTSGSNVYRSLLGAYGGSGSANMYLRSATPNGEIVCALEGMPSAQTRKISNAWYLLSTRFDEATGVELSINGSVVSQTGSGNRTPVPQNGVTPPLIGATYYGGGVVDKHVGYIAELIIFPNRLGDADYNSIIDYLKTKYGFEDLTEPLTTGLKTNWDASQGVYKDAGVTLAGIGDSIQQWNDQSGNGYHATQITSGDQPVLQSVDGVNVPFFAGVSEHLKHSYLGDAQTIYIVYKPSDTGANQRIAFGTGNSTSSPLSSYFLRANNSSSQADWVRNGGMTVTFPRAVNQWAAHTLTYDNTSLKGEVFNGAVSQGVDTGTSKKTGGGTGVIGASGKHDGSVFGHYKGHIAQILTYDVKHTTLERLAMNNFLKDKWSVL